MRDLNKIALECIRELYSIGIPFGDIKRFEINKRAKRRWGQCRKEPDGFVIEVAAMLLDEENPECALKDTLIHEILHTCRGCQDHGSLWKLYAEKVNLYYGYNIKRTSSAEDKKLKVGSELSDMDIKYQFICKGCQQIVNRSRKCKFVDEYENYRCGICGEKFERIK